jgi:NAD-dependent dihydropyrimidine dehydrogenase PreA subunit
MSLLYRIWINTIETLLRFFPFPVSTGLRKIGQPNRTSPVLVTGNFELTVLRVQRALQGLDCYLLVANSRGINVWCAASGGHFSHHDVISVVKTSGVEALVDHRVLILPQLAATGIETRKIYEKTGWQVQWGPVEAADLPAFLDQNHKSPDMRTVCFPLVRRLEMATAWAFPMAIFGGLLALLVWPAALLQLILLIWGMAFVLYAAFPLYECWLIPLNSPAGHVDIRPYGLALIVWGLTSLVICVVLAIVQELTWQVLWPWLLAALLAALPLCVDLAGSTPTYKSGTHADYSFVVKLDRELCTGCRACRQVCPRNVLDMQADGRKAVLARSVDCVRCGACIVQCPVDALWFQNGTGKIITPDTVRRYKLNLMGKRTVQK